MRTTTEQYGEIAKKASPNTQMKKTLPKAFFCGGLICVFGEMLMTLYGTFNSDIRVSGALTSITIMAITAVLTGTGLFQKFATFAGAGALIPITGFANSVVASAMEFKTEGFVSGVGAKMFTIAGPVIIYGVSAAAVWGVIYYLMGVFA